MSEVVITKNPSLIKMSATKMLTFSQDSMYVDKYKRWIEGIEIFQKDLEQFRHGGVFHLLLWYPELQQFNEWYQETNPVTKQVGGVEGYEVRLWYIWFGCFGGLQRKVYYIRSILLGQVW